MTVGSVIGETYSTANVKQHPFGTRMIAVDVRFPNSSVSCGVKIAKDEGRTSPSVTNAKAIGTTSDSSGSDTFPLNVT